MSELEEKVKNGKGLSKNPEALVPSSMDPIRASKRTALALAAATNLAYGMICPNFQAAQTEMGYQGQASQKSVESMAQNPADPVPSLKYASGKPPLALDRPCPTPQEIQALKPDYGIDNLVAECIVVSEKKVKGGKISQPLFLRGYNSESLNKYEAGKGTENFFSHLSLMNFVEVYEVSGISPGDSKSRIIITPEEAPSAFLLRYRKDPKAAESYFAVVGIQNLRNLPQSSFLQGECKDSWSAKSVAEVLKVIRDVRESDFLYSGHIGSRFTPKN